jgi:L-proline amide hydrolase
LTIAAADTEGSVDFGPWKTWYRITGDLSSSTTPLVVLHGGPGCTHHYVLRIAELAQRDGVPGPGRPVIHYDQVGSGRSTRLKDEPQEFWTVQLFLDQLDSLLADLGIADDYDLLGQSWGGMLAAEHAVRQPAGLRRLVIADSPASMETWVKAANELRAELPDDVQKTLTEHEQAGTIDSPEYLAASEVFYARHVCRVQPMPPEVQATFDLLAEDPTVYRAMNGPTEFHVTGSLRHWSIVDRLSDINVPTLVISGRYDEATPEVVAPYVDNIPDSRWVLFEESSHMPHVEEPDRYMEVVDSFLNEQG